MVFAINPNQLGLSARSLATMFERGSAALRQVAQYVAPRVPYGPLTPISKDTLTLTGKAISNNGLTRESVAQIFERYLSKSAIEQMVLQNQAVGKILRDVGVNEVKISEKVLEDLKGNHLPSVEKITSGIIDNLTTHLKQSVNRGKVELAALIHDVGKAAIPEEIVFHPGKLEGKSLEIMQTHSDLGYQMLKTQKELNSEVLNLVKNHHKPALNSNPVSRLEEEILCAADMYDALRTDTRSYKEAFDKKKALTIIYGKVKAGEISLDVFGALVRYANKIENIARKAVEPALAKAS